MNFVEYDLAFLECSWKWLNDPEIKELTDTPVITREIQVAWFDSLKNKPDYKVWGVENENEKIGVVGLKNISDGRGEYFGYIGEKTYWNKGLGKYMINHVCAIAKENGLKEIWLRVLKSNERAVKAYLKYGFITYSESDTAFLMCYNLV